MKTIIAFVVCFCIFGFVDRLTADLIPANGIAEDAGKIPQLLRLADAGDAEAAYRLYVFFDFYTPQHEKAVRYLRISAKLQYLKAMEALGDLLVDSKNAADRKEAVRWLKMAANKGSMYAKSILELYSDSISKETPKTQ